MTKQTEQGAAFLRSCPFCGAGTTQFRENGKTWTGQRYGEPASVSVMHWCEPVDGQPSRSIERVGRDRASAIEAWNRRAPNPTPEGCGFAQVDLTDDEIDACVGNLGMAPYSVLAGPEEIRKFARKLLAAWAEAAPPGYALVPLEPTLAMLDAVAPFPEHLRAEHPDPNDPWHAAMRAGAAADQAASAFTYRTMLAAATSHPTPKE